MPVVIERTNLGPIWPEVKQLVIDHYADTPVAQEGIPPLDMDWNFFLNLEESGNLCFFTAREPEGSLVGINMYMVLYHPQHIGRLVAICNSLVTVHRYRGHGIGTSLIETALEHFETQTDVEMVTHGYRTVYKGAKPLFSRLGFTRAEETWTKLLNREGDPR